MEGDGFLPREVEGEQIRLLVLTLLLCLSCCVSGERTPSKCSSVALVIPDDRKRLHPGLHVPRHPPSAAVSGAQPGARGEPSQPVPSFSFLDNCSVKLKNALKPLWASVLGFSRVDIGVWQWTPAAQAWVREAKGHCYDIRT